MPHELVPGRGSLVGDHVLWSGKAPPPGQEKHETASRVVDFNILSIINSLLDTLLLTLIFLLMLYFCFFFVL